VLTPKRLCLVVSSRSVRCSRKSLAANGGKFEIRYFQAIGAARVLTAHRPGMSTTRVSGPRYHGVVSRRTL